MIKAFGLHKATYQNYLAQLHQKNHHAIKNIFKDMDLDEVSTGKNFLLVRLDGHRNVKRNIRHLFNRAVIYADETRLTVNDADKKISVSCGFTAAVVLTLHRRNKIRRLILLALIPFQTATKLVIELVA